MKRNDERKLEIISGIDDKYLEKATQARLLLSVVLSRKKKDRSWIPPVAMAASFLLIVGALLSILPLILLGERQIPVYQGMTVSNQPPLQSTASQPVTSKLLSMESLHVTPLRQGNTVDQANPFGQSNPGIDHAISDRFPSVRPAETEYYAKANEDIYIHIHISNPDKFEILSFTLNGKKYSSYMFEAGSDMETLILKHNVGDVDGTQTYTIDAIKYIDGEEIKDVRMDGDRTVQVHIYPEDQPTVAITDLICEQTSATMTPTVTDPLHLISNSQGQLYAVLYDGVNIIVQTPLTSGDAVTFTDLTPGALYQYAIVALYDAIDGQGKAPHILYREAFRTEIHVVFENVTVKGLTAMFSLIGGENVSSLKLYEGETLYRELSPNDRVVEHLPIDKEVTLVAIFGAASATYTASYTLPVIRESEGLQIVNGKIVGMGSCTDTVLYFNHPIENYAFCTIFFPPSHYIAEVYCGDGVTSIGDHAFRLCPYLETIVLPQSLSKIGDEILYSCTNLKSVTFPDTLESIPHDTFMYCDALSEIFIPKSVTSIEARAFSDCPKLTDVYYEGTEDEWNAIVIDEDGNQPLLDATIHYQSKP